MNTRNNTQLPQRPQRARVKGHRLTVQWSGERGSESTSTGACSCGWSEDGSNARVVRDEYAHHLDKVWRAQQLQRVSDDELARMRPVDAYESNALRSERARRGLSEDHT